MSGGLFKTTDLSEAPVGPTRAGRSIDRAFTNLSDDITNAGVLPPLETSDSDKKSDHLLAFVECRIPRHEAYEVLRYTYRLYTEKGAEGFGKWLVMHDWGRVLEESGSNRKADAYQRQLDAGMDIYFPYVTTMRRSSDVQLATAERA